MMPVFKYVFLCLLAFSVTRAWAQTPGNAPSAADIVQDSTVQRLLSSLTTYGSIRIGVGVDETGEIGVTNNAPRAGLLFKHKLTSSRKDNFNVVGGVELGFDLVRRDETFEFVVDPGTGVAQVDDAVFTRLGFLGLTYRALTFTFGKQNSVYYTLGAIQADHFLAFGGAALGVWNAGTDGGVSGTGRANQAVILTYTGNRLTVGAQMQARNVSDNNQSVDSYGGAVRYEVNGFAIGAGYNKVNDGVSDPTLNQAKEGDEAWVASASYEFNQFLLAASFSDLTRHEKASLVDETSPYYSALGWELYVRYMFEPRKVWHVAVGYNYLQPDANQGIGDYDTKFAVGEVAYKFKKESYVFATAKLDHSLDEFGNSRGPNLYGIGIRFTF